MGYGWGTCFEGYQLQGMNGDSSDSHWSSAIVTSVQLRGSSINPLLYHHLDKRAEYLEVSHPLCLLAFQTTAGTHRLPKSAQALTQLSAGGLSNRPRETLGQPSRSMAIIACQIKHNLHRHSSK